jgi:hypothetical protein
MTSFPVRAKDLFLLDDECGCENGRSQLYRFGAPVIEIMKF